MGSSSENIAKLLGTGVIKFELINLPVDIRWQIKELTNIKGMMVGGAKSIEDEEPRVSEAIAASHEYR